MPALMAVIAGRSDPLQKELALVEAMAKRTGQNIAKSIQEPAGMSSTGGMKTMMSIRHIMTELSEGNLGALPMPVLHLVHSMGLLEKITGSTASASSVAAKVYGEEATKLGEAAIASTKKAAAAQADLYAVGGETEANLEAAVSSERKAAADIAAAEAARLKAQTAIEDAESTAAQGASNSKWAGALTTGVIAATAAVMIYRKAMEWINKKVEYMAGPSAPKVDVEPLAKQHQAAYHQTDLQNKLNESIEKEVNLYNSAAKAAERVAEQTRVHYDHVKKMDSFNKQRELDGAKNESQKLEIEKKYSDLGVQRIKQQRDEEVKNKETEKKNLEAEATKLYGEAAGMGKINSEEKDREDVKVAKGKADEARKFKEESEKEGHAEKGDAEYFKKTAEADKAIEGEKDAVQRAADNAELRRKRGEIEKRAEQAYVEASKIGVSLTDTKKKNAEEVSNAQMEADTEWRNQVLQASRKVMGHGDITQNQRLGAYSTAASPLVVINQKMAKTLEQIEKNTSNKTGGFGAVQY